MHLSSPSNVKVPAEDLACVCRGVKQLMRVAGNVETLVCNRRSRILGTLAAAAAAGAAKYVGGKAAKEIDDRCDWDSDSWSDWSFSCD